MRQKALAAQTLKMLAAYRQSEEFSHFGSELAVEAKKALDTGKRVFELLTQSPTEVFSLASQQLMLDITLNLEEGEKLDISQLMLNVNEVALTMKDDSDESHAKALKELKKKSLVELKGAPKPKEEKKELPEDDKKAPKEIPKKEEVKK